MKKFVLTEAECRDVYFSFSFFLFNSNSNLKLKTIVCCNSGGVYSSETVASTMVTSLLHAYDYCRGNYDSKDLKHLACTEVGLICANYSILLFSFIDCTLLQ